jgi:hypothetical protein
MKSENTELVISESHLNRFAFLSIIGVIVLFYLPFAFYWGFSYTLNGFWYMVKVLIFWIVPIILIHEGLHGLLWALALKGDFRQIRFGFNKQMLTPYTHCKVPLPKRSYFIGGLAPLVIMGLIPALLSFIFGNPYYFTLSLVCIWTSSGDIISCFYLLKIPNTYNIQDHPDKLGFILVEK